ncbi:hypothetical protein FBY14_12447 [Azospirillum brasilense]|nr:hypothetical protein FBY14_12447 [Azospirillum brasilense]
MAYHPPNAYRDLCRRLDRTTNGPQSGRSAIWIFVSAVELVGVGGGLWFLAEKFGIL